MKERQSAIELQESLGMTIAEVIPIRFGFQAGTFSMDAGPFAQGGETTERWMSIENERGNTQIPIMKLMGESA